MKEKLNMDTIMLENMLVQQELLFSHAKQLHLSVDSMKSVLEDLCERISTIMDCERVSIWLFNEDWTVLTAQNIFSTRTRSHKHGQKLNSGDFPSYFKAIQQERTLAVENVYTNSVVRELKKHYFQDDDIHSMLDASIILSRGIGGMLCCETKKDRTWSSLDKIIIASITDMIAFVFNRLHRIEMDKHIYALAFTDTLTDLHNQYSYTNLVNQQINDFNYSDQGVIIYFKIDQFTHIQGVLGHEIGEQVLKVTAKRLQNLFPKPAITARLGFDHFIIFTPVEFHNVTEDLYMAPLLNVLKQPMDICGQEIFVTYSYGISFYPENFTSAREGIQTSQVALETSSRKSSREAQGIFNPDMQVNMEKTMFSEMNLRNGLNQNEFHLYYQPQVNGLLGELVGFEALIRWQHPERGLIFPGDFIELAESTGLIIPLGEWVIKEAFTQLKRWEKKFESHLTISINLSPRHFLHPDLPSYLIKCAQETGVDTKKLVLEITENVALEDFQAVKNRMNELNCLGFEISIDDFGTGYSAFIYLQHFSVQQIKIDQQFISGLNEDPKSEAIVRTIIELGNRLGLQLIAEGVETKLQSERLKELGCLDMQGYYFGRPIPVDEINKQLTSVLNNRKVFLPIQDPSI